MNEPILDKLLEAHLAYKRGKVHEYEIARVQADARVQDLLDARNALAAEAEASGIPMSRIAKVGLGTTNWATARNAAAAGHEIKGEAA